MKSLTTLWQVAANELAARCSTSTARDYEYLTSRVEREGLSFLTIALPAFASDFERSLELGRVESGAFQGFKRPRTHRGLPLFLRGFLTLVFDPHSGLLVDVPSVEAIYAVRQLCHMYGKILIPCSEERVRGAVQRYVDCERELEGYELAGVDFSDLRRISNLLYGDVFERLNNEILEGALYPRHGPGATADKLQGNAKFDLKRWTTRLESLFPFGEYAIPSWRFNYLLDDVEFAEPGAELPVRVVTVPKTLKTPRIIAIEPAHMQYMQQAISGRLIELLESHPILGSDGANLIGFMDQVPNQDLAMTGSISGFDAYLATLDLSDASDRVSNQHVQCLIDPVRYPFLSEAVQAVRTQTADVPGHGIIPLAKYASMGSALTFPVESMVFLSIICLSLERSLLNRHFSRRDLVDLAGCVRVYGDDLICPRECAPSVVATLESFNFRVNVSKSFWNGLFRESCGREYYDGQDVSVVRCRRKFPVKRTDYQEVIALVSLRNQFYMSGLWGVASWLDRRLARLLRSYPTVHPTSPVLGRWSGLEYDTHRFDRYTQSPLVKGYVVSSNPPASIASGEGALLKFLLKRSEMPIADSRHLERQGRPKTVRIKLRWGPPF